MAAAAAAAAVAASCLLIPVVYKEKQSWMFPGTPNRVEREEKKTKKKGWKEKFQL